jgi:hypothetical protein
MYVLRMVDRENNECLNTVTAITMTKIKLNNNNNRQSRASCFRFIIEVNLIEPVVIHIQ